MIIRTTTIRIWTIISICSSGLYTTACDSGELPGKKENPENTELRFTASISDNPSTRAAHGANNMAGTAFPDGTHTFGMFITGEEGRPLATGSNDNMKSILTRGSNPDTWIYTDKNDQSISLHAKHGELVNITGYYPWVSGASATAVPFDLSGDVATWTDLLYLSSPAGAEQALDATPIALTFSHAYCWVTIKLSKLTDKNEVHVKAVGIENSFNVQNGIIVSGTINPKTGDVINGTPGSLVINCNPPISIPYITGMADLPSEFNFLVPSFMREDVKNSDIVIRVVTETETTHEIEALLFPLNREHLNNIDTRYGFEKGKHNTYNVVYNNAEMVLSLSNWQEVLIAEQGLGEGTTGVQPVTVQYAGAIKDLFGQIPMLATSDHHYHDYLGEVAENNNGEYCTIDAPAETSTLYAGWLPFMKKILIYPKLMIARNLGAGGALIPWKDEITGALLAKQVCADLRDGGYNDWRLPRISELAFFAYQVPAAVNKNAGQLWSATEHDAGHCYSIDRKTDNSSILPTIVSKYATNYVRCVRDFDKPKSTI